MTQSLTIEPLTNLLASLESGSRPRGGVRGITSGVPSLGGEHLNDKGGFRLDKIRFVPDLFAASMRRGHIHTGDTLIVKDGATTGKCAIVRDTFPLKKAVVNEHVFVCRPNGRVVPEFLFWYLYSPMGNQQVMQDFRGAAQGGITQAFVEYVKVPLPNDKQIQQIISKKLDNIATRLADTEARLKAIPSTLKRFRMSVLAAACSGRLTEKWRRDERLLDWEQTCIGDVIQGKPKNGYSANPVNYETRWRVLTLTATTSGNFDRNQFKFFDEPIPADSPFWCQPGDILVQRGNTIEYVGVPAIYTGKPREFIFPDLMMRLRASERVDTHFLYYALSNASSRQFMRDKATGTAGNMPKINQQVLMQVPIDLPPITEQHEIVKRVSGLFRFADEIEARLISTKKYVDRLMPSVLTRSFEN
ncbi:MAG: restriction endonuclease subunit S [Proteobacteria bacterium]|nr:restriction endonuclease subunit S [Pseudomonadota bacterium]HQR02861.1 restriction endonuclease subunit S [Rhodocyclaceae bacterium]